MHGTLSATLEDTAAAKPAAGLRMQLYWVEPAGEVLLRTTSTQHDGTTAKPLLDSVKFSAGSYRLILHTGDYFAGSVDPESARFFEILAVHFVIADASVDVRLRIAISPTAYTVTRV